MKPEMIKASLADLRQVLGGRLTNLEWNVTENWLKLTFDMCGVLEVVITDQPAAYRILTLWVDDAGIVRSKCEEKKPCNPALPPLFDC